LSNIAFDLFDIGGRTSACWTLYFRYLKDLQHLPLEDRVRIGTKLLEVLVANGQDFETMQLIQKLTPSFEAIPQEDNRRRAYANLEIRALISACAFSEAKDAITSALQWASPEESAVLTAELVEIELLQGVFEQSKGN
jgi:hypothetical protein